MEIKLSRKNEYLLKVHNEKANRAYMNSLTEYINKKYPTKDGIMNRTSNGKEHMIAVNGYYGLPEDLLSYVMQGAYASLTANKNKISMDIEDWEKLFKVSEILEKAINPETPTQPKG